MSEDRPVPGWWLSSGGSLRSGNPVVIGMHPFERGVQPGPLCGRHPGQHGLEASSKIGIQGRTAYAARKITLATISGARDAPVGGDAAESVCPRGDLNTYKPRVGQ